MMFAGFTTFRIAMAGALGCLALAVAMPGVSLAEYPERTVTMIVCFPAGGGTDVAARLINTQLGEALGKPVIVENRGGAGGSLASAYVARAKPDGYTLLACSGAFVVNPSLYPNASYDPIKDFIPIMVFGSSPTIFVVPEQSSIKTMKEFIAVGKANPGRLNWTSPGAGTTPQLAGEILRMKAGIDMVHIPYTGAGPAMTAVLGGQVDMYTANYGSITGLLAGGKIRPIAVAAAKRMTELPDVPTLEELGIPDSSMDNFQGLFAPADTPKPIIDRLAKELAAILARPEVKERYQNIGLTVTAEGPELFRRRIAHEVPMYRDIIKKGGLEVK
jgi:tripartite-type tricarboxylate transporter receptor subunit TctC